MLEKIIPDEFDKVFEIMENSFPTDEYRPYPEQKALLGNPIYEVYASRKQGEIMAFIATYRLDNVLFAEHLAVDERYRNMGLGAKILKELLEREQAVCLEVEPPATDIAKRRIAFYERNGFFLNDYPYIQPAISKGKKPVPLMIMTSNGKISEAEFEKLKNEIYHKVYRVK